MIEARAYWVVEPGRGELRGENVDAQPGSGESVVRALHGGLLPGLERLVGTGRVSPAADGKMGCRGMAGSFALPVKFGGGVVGEGIAGALLGRSVFVRHPHQTHLVIEDGEAVVLPEKLPVARATLIPALEAALNGVWDAELGPHEPCVVVGAGMLGLLVAYVLARERTHFAMLEIDEQRATFARELPWIQRVLHPEELAAESVAVAFHCAGNAMGLQAAMSSVVEEGRIIDLACYGTDAVFLELDLAFRSGSKRLQGSNPRRVARSRSGFMGPRERMSCVLALLDDRALDALLGQPVPFSDLPDLMSRLYRGTLDHPVPVISYVP